MNLKSFLPLCPPLLARNVLKLLNLGLISRSRSLALPKVEKTTTPGNSAFFIEIRKWNGQ